MIPIKPVTPRSDSGPPAAAPRAPAAAALQFLQPGALNLAALPPLSLYVHLPWCVRNARIAISTRTNRKGGASGSSATWMRCAPTWNSRCR